MCGFVGFIGTNWSNELSLSVVNSMADAVSHRGSDAKGAWISEDGSLALGHRRLSIIEISAAGHQPMFSANGSYVIVFNGEIYNHFEIRRQLESSGFAPSWHGNSDTETLLAAFEAFGVENTLERTIGMFAFALWNIRTRSLYLARDRFGEKPLYYGWIAGNFVFGSELKALRAFPGFNNSVCRDALAEYLNFMYIPAPKSIYQDIYKLEPGCMLTLRQPLSAAPPSEALAADSTYGSISIQRWWSLENVIIHGIKNRITNEHDAISELESRLLAAINLQSIADVSLGAFLSGGVDSSLIVALMQSQSSKPIKTFSVGFEESGFDESPYARAVAYHLGTEHFEFFVTANDARNIIPKLPWMYDEPFADASQIPTHLVCEAARKKVTVALSGDAGDELFGGYNRYFWGPRVWRRVGNLPYGIRQLLAQGLQTLSPSILDCIFKFSSLVRPGEKLHKLGRALKNTRTIDDLYFNLVSEWRGKLPVLGTSFLNKEIYQDVKLNDARARMMYWDSKTYLPDDILCKVDRAAMAIGLETRVPFLDHRVFALAWQLPMSMKIRDNKGKWALRKILYQYVPKELIERPKAGFALPIGKWLRGPLREWAEELLNQKRIEREGYLDAKLIQKTWQQYLSGQYDWTARIWGILMFQAWLDTN